MSILISARSLLAHLWQGLTIGVEDWRAEGKEPADEPEETLPMTRYPENTILTADSWHPQIESIVVRDPQSKVEILEALRYLHDGQIDTGYMAVSEIVHQYLTPDRIVVAPPVAAPAPAAAAPMDAVVVPPPIPLVRPKVQTSNNLI